MEKAEFRERVRSGAASLPPDAVSAAILHYEEKEAGALNRAGVTRCVLLAGSFRDFRKQLPTDGVDSFFAFSHSPLGELTERQTLAAVESWVRQIREKVFGAPEAPFTPEQYPEAVAWLEAEDERTHNPPTPEESERYEEIERQIMALMREASAITGGTHTHVPSRVTVGYWRADGERRSLSCGRQSPKLNALIRGAVQIAEATGFSQPSVVGYLLADIPPVLPTVRFTTSDRSSDLPTGGVLERKRVTVEIETFSPSEADLREILQKVRALRTEKPEDEALRRILREVGGVLERPPRSFWEDVAKRWEEAGFRNGSPDALRVRFQRLPDDERRALRSG